MITREDKELLLKDLCGRLPYGVIVDYKENEFEIPHWKITTIYPDTFGGRIGYNKRVGAGSESGSRPFKIGEVKPYLRPMDSMTENEQEEFFDLIICVDNGKAVIEEDKIDAYNNFIYSHHLDNKNFIGKGLALEAPEGMYNVTK